MIIKENSALACFLLLILFKTFTASVLSAPYNIELSRAKAASEAAVREGNKVVLPSSVSAHFGADLLNSADTTATDSLVLGDQFNLEATAETRIVDMHELESASSEAGVLLAPSMLPASPTPAPLPFFTFINPIVSLWNFLFGAGAEIELPPGSPETIEKLHGQVENDEFQIVYGVRKGGVHTFWIRTSQANGWDEFPLPDGLLKDTAPAIGYDSIVWMNEKKTALYRYDLYTKGVSSESYRTGAVDSKLNWDNRASEPVSAEYDERSRTILFREEREQ